MFPPVTYVYTPPKKFHIAPEKWWLKHYYFVYFPFGARPQGLAVKLFNYVGVS